MRKLYRNSYSLVVAVLAFLLLTCVSQAEVAIATNGGASGLGHDAVGLQFRVGPRDIEVYEFGVYDHLGDGVDTPNEVDLWSETGTNLKRVAFPQGTSARLESRFRWLALATPLRLSANTTYRLSAFSLYGEYRKSIFVPDSATTISSAITFLSGVRSNNSSSNVFPSQVFGTNQLIIGANIRFNVIYSPPSVSTWAATAVASNAASIRGIVDTNGLETTAYFEFGTTNSYGSSTPAQAIAANAPVTPFSASLSQLQPNTLYHYRLVATNNQGTSYGADQTFLTSATPSQSDPWQFNSFTIESFQAGSTTDVDDVAVYDEDTGALVYSNDFDSEGDATRGLNLYYFPTSYENPAPQLNGAKNRVVNGKLRVETTGFNQNGAGGYDSISLASYSGGLPRNFRIEFTATRLQWPGHLHFHVFHQNSGNEASPLAPGGALFESMILRFAASGSWFQNLSVIKGLKGDAIQQLPAPAGDSLQANRLGISKSGPVIRWWLNGNEVGQFTLPLPPSAQTATSEQVGVGSVKMNGAANPNGQATTAYFEYGATTAYGSTTPAASIGNGLNDVPLSAMAAGLQRGATFHYRLVATNDSGTSFGEDQTFTTAPNAVPQALPDVKLVYDRYQTTVDVLSNDSDEDGDSLVINSVTQGAQGSVVLKDGKLVYTPDSSFSDEDSFSYTVSDGAGGAATATVKIRNPYPSWTGRYSMVFRDGQGRPLGSVDISLAANGALTGVLRYEGQSYRFKDALPLAGLLNKTFARKAKSQIVLRINLDPLGVAKELSGSIQDGISEFAATGEAKQLVTKNCPEAGTYTLLLSSPSSSAPLVAYGFATLSVGKNASVRLAGKLGDGTALAIGSKLRVDSTSRVLASLYGKKRGYLLGSLSFMQTESSDLTGTLQWHRPSMSFNGSDPAFVETLQATGSRYASPGRAELAWDYSESPARVIALLSGGGLQKELTHTFAVLRGDKLKVSDPAADDLKVQIVRKSGLITGSFLHPLNQPNRLRKRTVFGGVILQKQNVGRGFFSGPSERGEVNLTPR